jgi:hypothetical protein
VITFCRAKARPAPISPIAVARRVGSSNQIEAMVSSSSAETVRLTTCRAQKWKRVPERLPMKVRSRARRSQATISAAATRANVRSSLRTFSESRRSA